MMSQRLYSKYSINSKESVMKKSSRKYLSSLTINELPPEILLKIFSFLHVKSLQNASLVCRKWRDLANDSKLWEAHYKEYFGNGVQSMYVKLKVLAMRPDIVDSSICWKEEFLSQCKIQSKKVLSKLKRNAYTGVSNNVDSFLTQYNINFQLCLICSGKETLFSNAQRHSFRTTTYLQWNSLSRFPDLKSIQTIQVIAISPLILKKSKKNLPIKKALVLSVEVGPKAIEQFTLLSEDGQNKIILRYFSGIMVAVWTGSNEIAFVSLCLHHHNFINRCILSSIEKPHIVKRKPIFDDVDPSYGMHGYQCHILIHTAEKVIWENKFSYITCSKVPDSEFLIMKPDICIGDKLNFSGFSWKTELFRGSFENVAVVSVTVEDANKEIIWAASICGKTKHTSARSVSFDYSGQKKSYLAFHLQKSIIGLD